VTAPAQPVQNMEGMNVDLVLVYTPVGGGHKAAALATAEAARARGLSVALVDAFEHAPTWATDAYLAAHFGGQGLAPSVYGYMYDASNTRGATEAPLRRGLDHAVFGGLARVVADLAPRAVVATHHVPLLVLGRARRKGRLAAPLVGVVTDYGAHACWAERGVDAWTVACPRAARDLAGHGVDRRRVRLTGIPVRPAFEACAPAQVPADGEPLRVLVTSGGFGVGPLKHILRSFRGVPGVELTVVCGASASIRAKVEREVERSQLSAEVVGFERDMPSRMAAAHVVVGKAGGLTVSEALTAGRALVLVGAVPGQEKINEAYVAAARAGVAAEPSAVGEVVVGLRGAVSALGVRGRTAVLSRSADRVVDVALALAAEAHAGTRAA
jgi:processive 1,2-diacylglycerol beta-glucosyltransferase